MPPILQNLIIVAVVLALVVSAIVYIVKQKKKGVRCIGCSQAGKCSRGSCAHAVSQESQVKVECSGCCSSCSSCYKK